MVFVPAPLLWYAPPVKVTMMDDEIRSAPVCLPARNLPACPPPPYPTASPTEGHGPFFYQFVCVRRGGSHL